MMTPVKQAPMALPAEKSFVNFSDGNREVPQRATPAGVLRVLRWRRLVLSGHRFFSRPDGDF